MPRWLIQAPRDPAQRLEAKAWITKTLEASPSGVPELDLDWWRSELYCPYQLDRQLGDACEPPLRELSVRTREQGLLELELQQILLRLQTRFPHTNLASQTPRFRELLRLHRKLHNLSLPLVRADFIHALDSWQWTLRLDPQADELVQAAALLHDLERLQSESRQRREHRAKDYQSFKDAHARAGAQMVKQVLLFQGWETPRARAVASLVAEHEKAGHSEASALLADADGLSFFSVNSAGYLDYFGESQSQKKMEWTLARMSPRARSLVDCLRMRPDVERLYRSL